jgi:hypothetical protein
MLKLEVGNTSFSKDFDISFAFTKVRLKRNLSLFLSLIIFIASLACKLFLVSIGSLSKVIIKLTLQESGDHLSGNKCL